MDPQAIDLPFILALVFRWLHILAAITAVGGSIFARFVVFPALDTLPGDERSKLHAVMRGHWGKFVAAAIGFLLVSGLYNFIITVSRFRVPSWYHMIFGIKFLLAMGIFAIASLLVGRSPAAEALRKNARLWLNLNIALAVLVVCLSGVLRAAVKKPKQPAELPAAAVQKSLALSLTPSSHPVLHWGPGSINLELWGMPATGWQIRPAPRPPVFQLSSSSP